MNGQTRETLRSLWTAESGKHFHAGNVMKAFSEAGAKVWRAESGNGFYVSYKGNTGMVMYVNGNGNYCHKPLGLPMYNILSLLLN